MKRIKAFFTSESAGGVLLILCTAVSLLLANGTGGEAYVQTWHRNIGGHELGHWINDLLMAIFFLLVGLELKREIYVGELSNKKSASLPAMAAIGGMLIPATIYLAFNAGTPTQHGFGIPMATDIAFALGVLSLLGKKVPTSMKIFLTALAVIDDLGAILVIAFFYSSDLSFFHLASALGIFAFLLVLNRLKIHNAFPYLLAGGVMWYFMQKSGVHATITGVLVAFAIPLNEKEDSFTSTRLGHLLHVPVTYFILPLFALANTAIILNASIETVVAERYSLGIVFGLIFGKPLGIFLLSWLSVKLGLSQLSPGLSWNRVIGLGFLGGIGFTMSIFMALLSFDDHSVTDNAKLMILLASLVAGLIGYLYLKRRLPPPHKAKQST